MDGEHHNNRISRFMERIHPNNQLNSENISGNIAENIPGNIAENIPGNIAENIPGNIAENIPGNIATVNNIAGNIAGNIVRVSVEEGCCMDGEHHNNRISRFMERIHPNNQLNNPDTGDKKSRKTSNHFLNMERSFRKMEDEQPWDQTLTPASSQVVDRPQKSGGEFWMC
ncbi:uncharacterized protein LOC135084451 [Ostrinia nubilalis]|uniref:uncharacterized protein LOC135084451 n=1 Tax=Ostrinia nubilalis TaxID=29057 RepID=UPI003082471B